MPASLHRLGRAFISAGLLIMLTISSLHQALVADLPDAGAFLTPAPPAATRTCDCQNRPLYETSDSNASLSLGEIPLHPRRATVAVENAGLWPRVGEIMPGSSPLTRQAVGLTHLSQRERRQRTLARKLEQGRHPVNLPQQDGPRPGSRRSHCRQGNH